jgi:hypothetical protein
MNRCFVAINLAAACGLALGVVGFMAPLGGVPFNIELPNSLGAVRVTAPDGRVFIASTPTGRVQRYGPDGFERAFFIDSRGGVFDTGISPLGEIMVCSARAKALISYDRDGLEIGQRKPCYVGSSGLLASPHYSVRADVPTIASSWLAAMAIPLWHPFMAWLIGVVSMIALKINFRELQRS